MAALLTATSLAALETPGYDVLERDGRFEVRTYEPHIVAETVVTEEYERSGSEGFSRLAGFIFGKNRTRGGTTAQTGAGESMKIAMTAPVAMQPVVRETQRAKQIRAFDQGVDRVRGLAQALGRGAGQRLQE